MKFGLIPEFIGRMSVTVTLDNLDKNALVSILTKPKNALVKQYKKLLEYDNVTLDFEDSALNAIADKAIERKTGARGLRAIMEETMSDIMFTAPSDPLVKKVVVSKQMVEHPGEIKLKPRAARTRTVKKEA